MSFRSRFALTAIAIATSAVGTRRIGHAPTIRGACFVEDGAADPTASGGDSVTVAPANTGDPVVETAAVENTGDPVVETAAVENTGDQVVGPMKIGPMKKRGNNCCSYGKDIHNYSLPNIKINPYNNIRFFLGNCIWPRARVSFNKNFLLNSPGIDFVHLARGGPFYIGVKFSSQVRLAIFVYFI